MNEKYGPDITETTLTDNFLTGPGQFLVKKLIAQMAKVDAFTNLFGPYRLTKTGDDLAPASQSQRWADYPRFDWSIRQLPAINIFESDPENKESSNAFLNGALSIQVFWPPKLRRSDWSRVPSVFRGAILNFFESDLVTLMLDEIMTIQRPEKVPGLNELGKNITWSPNTEGIIETEMVPVTMFSVRYRIDLRSWYRFLEMDGRTKGTPFTRDLENLKTVEGEYQGIPKDPNDIQVRVPDKITINE